MKRRSTYPFWPAGAWLVVPPVLGIPAAAPAAHPSDTEIRGRLDDIMSRPEFKPGEDFWLRVLRGINVFFQWLAELRQTQPVLFFLLIVACLAALALFVALVIWMSSRIFRFSSRVPSQDNRAAERQRLSTRYWEDARRLAATGEFTEAVRFLFLSLVYRFDEAGKVAFQKALTNREYLAHFEDRRPVHARLKVFVDTLDDHWYGQRPTDRKRYEACLALYGQLT
jgi:hypothetical protein